MSDPDDIEKLHELIDQLRGQLTEAKAANDELFKIKQKVVIANRELIKNLAVAVEALKWYADAIYPDDGSGRPSDAYQQCAKTTLARIGGSRDA
jgi:hypothetical protein